MKELVTAEQATHFIRLAAMGLPVLGLLVGLIAGALRRRVGVSAAVGLLIGLAGPAAYGLWFVYNGIMGRYGLDSVKGLVLNLGLFAVLGLAIGVGAGLVRRRLAAGSNT